MNQQRAQEGSSSLSNILRLSQGKNTIQVNNKTKNLGMAKQQYGFGEGGENPRVIPSPKGKTLH